MIKEYLLEVYRGRRQVQQHDHDKGSRPGLAGYTIWKSDTKLVI